MTYDDHVDCDNQLNEAEDKIVQLQADLAAKTAEIEETRLDLHDVHCNADRRKPRYAKGSGCSCGRLSMLQERNDMWLENKRLREALETIAKYLQVEEDNDVQFDNLISVAEEALKKGGKDED